MIGGALCTSIALLAGANTAGRMIMALWRRTTAPAPTLSFVAAGVDEQTNRVFLVDRTWGLLVLDSRTGQLRHLGLQPPQRGAAALVVDERAGRVFVAVAPIPFDSTRPARTTLSVIDTHTLRLLHTRTLGVGPPALALDPGAGRLIVANQGDNTASILDAQTSTVVRTVPIVTWATGVVVDSHLHLAFVLGSMPDHQTHAVTVFDTHQGRVIRALQHLGQPTGGLVAAAIDEATQHLFVANNGSVLDGSHPKPSLAMVDAPTGRLLRTLPINPIALVLDSSSARLFVTGEPDTVYVVNTHTGATMHVINLPPYQYTSDVQEIALDGRTRHIFVAGYVPGVSMLAADTGHIVRLRQGANGTTMLVVDERAGRVVAAGDYGVAILDSQTGLVVRTLTPASIAASIGEHTQTRPGASTLTILE